MAQRVTFSVLGVIKMAYPFTRIFIYLSCAFMLSGIAVAGTPFATSAPGVTSVACPNTTITTSGTCDPLASGGVSGNVVTSSGTNTVQDSGTALSALAPKASPTFTGTVTVPGATTSSLSAGPLSAGTLSFPDTGLAASFQASINGYQQLVLQNTSSGAAASADFIVANNQGTASTHYGDFGINSSGFTGTGSFNIAGATYLYGQTGDLVLGTLGSNAVHFVVGNGATDAMTIGTGGGLTLNNALTYGGVTLSNAVTGTGNMVLATSPSFTTPNVGAALATSINGTLVPTTSGDTVATLAANQTFTGANAFNPGAITTNVKAINLTATFNNSSQVFDAPFFENITNTASMAGSYIFDVQVGGTSVFQITPGGSTSVASLFSSNNVTVGTNGQLTWNSSRGILTSPAAATIQLGAADAASPVAQTLQAQSVVTGTSNTAGALTKIKDSGGTGTGASGGFEFDLHPAGTTGSTPNAAASAMTLNTPAASQSFMTITTNPYTGGNATTNTPLIYCNGGSAPTTWSAAGTYYGCNAVSGYTGNMLDFHVNGGASIFSLAYNGNVTDGGWTFANSTGKTTSTLLEASSAGSAGTPSLQVGGTTNGLYAVSTTGLGASVGGAVKADYGITNSAAWTMQGALYLPGLASSSAATTGTLCWTTSTGLVNVDTTLACLSSTRRVKMNERPLVNGLAEVMKLRPVSYDLKPQFNPEHLGRQVGLIAEDVQEVDPRLVGLDKDGKPRGVRYMQSVAVLVKAVQEEEAEIAELREEVSALTTAYKDLTTQQVALQDRVQ